MSLTTEDLACLHFENIDPNIFFHGVFGRAGGVSPPPFDSLNVSHGVGDDPANVDRNRRRLKRKMDIDRLVSLQQVHGDRICVVDRGPEDDREFEGYDALITDQPDIGLMILQADCQAVLLVDAGRRLAGICHVGWRGSVQGIIGKTVEAMRRDFGAVPGELRAAIGPSLGPCCAEFINFQRELPRHMWHYQVAPNRFDFWEISRMQLRRAGVPDDNIETAALCTRCSEAYFSYRRDKTTGRFASVIGIRGNQ